MTRHAWTLPLAVLMLLPSPARAARRRAAAGPCAADVRKFCADVKPAGPAVGQCLDQHKQEISAECRAARERGEQMRQEFESACGKDRETLCPSSKGSEIRSCFREHEKDLSPGCTALLEKRKEQFMASHPRIAAITKACEADAAKLCKGWAPGGGRIQSCLLRHKSELTPACAAALSESSGESKD